VCGHHEVLPDRLDELAHELVRQHGVVDPLLDQLLALRRVRAVVVARDARVAAAQAGGHGAQLALAEGDQVRVRPVRVDQADLLAHAQAVDDHARARS
jgi:hypothetical protein